MNVYKRNSMVPTLMIYNHLFKLLTRNGKLEELAQYYKEMQQNQIVPNALTYSTLVTAHEEEVDIHYQFAGEIVHFKILPEQHTFRTIIKAFAKKSDYKSIEEFYSQLRQNGFQPTQETYHSIIDICRKDTDSDLIATVVKDMKADDIPPSLQLYNTLIVAYGHRNDFEGISRIKQEIKEAGLTPDIYIYTSLIHIYGKHKDFAAVSDLLKEIEVNGLSLSFATYHALISVFSKHVSLVKMVHAEMTRKNIPLSIKSVTLLRQIYKEFQDVEGLLLLHNEVLASGLKVDNHYFVDLITGLRKMETFPNVLKQLEGDMHLLGISPSLVYERLIHLYARHNDNFNLHRLFERFDQDHAELAKDLTIMTAFIYAYGKVKRFDYFQYLVQQVLDTKDKELPLSTYNAILFGYANLRQDHEILPLVSLMNEKKIALNDDTYTILLQVYLLMLKEILQLMEHQQMLIPQALYSQLAEFYQTRNEPIFKEKTLVQEASKPSRDSFDYILN